MEILNIYFQKVMLIVICIALNIDKYKSEQIFPTIKDIRNTLGTKQDLNRVNLGISEKYPNTRAMYYVDLNNDK
jgi:hypothetical protein